MSMTEFSVFDLKILTKLAMKTRSDVGQILLAPFLVVGNQGLFILGQRQSSTILEVKKRKSFKLKLFIPFEHPTEEKIHTIGIAAKII